MKVSVLAAALGVIGFGSPAVAADLVDVTSHSYGAGGQGGGIRVVSLGVAEYGPTGRFDLSGNYAGSIASFVARSFCFDVTRGLFDSAPDNQFEIRSLSAFSTNPIKQSQVAALLLNTQALINNASSSAARDLAAVATGLAIWEILYETGTTGYSVSGVSGDAGGGDGNFYTYGDFAIGDTQLVPYQATANQYLAKVESGEWTGSTSRIRTLVSFTGDAQNQLIITAVPEPATWTMMVLGFGAMGAALRRRNSRRIEVSASAA